MHRGPGTAREEWTGWRRARGRWRVTAGRDLDASTGRRRWAAPTVVAVATGIAATAPLWLAFSVLSRHLDLSRLPTWAAFSVGLPLFAALLVVPAVVWGLVVAAVVRSPRRPVVRAAILGGVLPALPVAVAVDVSQALIDTVRPWHRLAVHGLFTVAFGAGLAVLLVVLTGRVRSAVGSGQAPAASAATLVREVAWATVLGTVSSSAMAVALGWVVEPGIGRRMLLPLYLVVVGGTAAGGAALGRRLPRSAGPR